MINRDIIKQLIHNYEQDIYGNRYTFVLSDGETVSFCIKKENVPHLLGVRKLPLRQVQNKSASAIYEMLKDGRINISHIEPYKEEYKKVMHFGMLTTILYCGDMVRIVKRIGSLKSSYLLYLDNSPNEIVHLGIVKDAAGAWAPESLLVLNKRNIMAYIDDQIQVEILSMTVTEETDNTKISDENNAYIV